jgi:hypothetical protein
MPFQNTPVEVLLPVLRKNEWVENGGFAAGQPEFHQTLVAFKAPESWVSIGF